MKRSRAQVLLTLPKTMSILFLLPMLLAQRQPISVHPRASILRRMPMFYGKRDPSLATAPVSFPMHPAPPRATFRRIAFSSPFERVPDIDVLSSIGYRFHSADQSPHAYHFLHPTQNRSLWAGPSHEFQQPDSYTRRHPLNLGLSAILNKATRQQNLYNSRPELRSHVWEQTYPSGRIALDRGLYPKSDDSKEQLRNRNVMKNVLLNSNSISNEHIIGPTENANQLGIKSLKLSPKEHAKGISFTDYAYSALGEKGDDDTDADSYWDPRS